jgi:hypothetical protein
VIENVGAVGAVVSTSTGELLVDAVFPTLSAAVSV